MRRSLLLATLATLALACTDEDAVPITYLDGRVDLAGDLTLDTGQLDGFPGDLPEPDTRPVKCGNGFAEGGEKCDGKDLDQQTCTTLGYFKGTLACTKVCTFDLNSCSNCGNSKLDKEEACDGKLLGGYTCKSLGYLKGTLTCTKVCGFDINSCSNCGNGKVDKVGEECDGTNLNNTTCKSLGFSGGTLKCFANCLFNKSGCS